MTTVSLNELQRRAAPPVLRTLEAGADPGDIALDTEQVFLVYASLCGDVDGVAAAVGVPPKIIARLADAESWPDRIAPLLAKRKSAKPGDPERAINRAINFAMAHRYRLFLQRVAQQLYAMPEAELAELLVKSMPGRKEEGGTSRIFFTRPLADLATAMEKAQMLTYLALKDTVSDRRGRETDGPEDELSAAALHAQITRAMDASREPQTAVGELAAAQIESAQAAAREAVIVSPAHPNDDDDH